MSIMLPGCHRVLSALRVILSGCDVCMDGLGTRARIVATALGPSSISGLVLPRAPAVARGHGRLP